LNQDLKEEIKTAIDRLKKMKQEKDVVVIESDRLKSVLSVYEE